ncbi:hypothetical protein PYCC9005_001675 [Savitreella phatthalungensis]
MQIIALTLAALAVKVIADDAVGDNSPPDTNEPWAPDVPAPSHRFVHRLNRRAVSPSSTLPADRNSAPTDTSTPWNSDASSTPDVKPSPRRSHHSWRPTPSDDPLVTPTPTPTPSKQRATATPSGSDSGVSALSMADTTPDPSATRSSDVHPSASATGAAAFKQPDIEKLHVNHGSSICFNGNPTGAIKGVQQTTIDAGFVQNSGKFSVQPSPNEQFAYAGKCEKPAGTYWAQAQEVLITGGQEVQYAGHWGYVTMAWLRGDNLHICWHSWQQARDTSFSRDYLDCKYVSG